MTNLAVGFGESVITPPLGVDLCGYGFYLDRKAETVLDDLKVRALYLSEGTESLRMIACDHIGLSVEFSDRLRTGLAAALGLPASRILVACTHTHSGPATQSLTGLGEVSPAYLEIVAKRIAEAAEEAAARPETAEFRTAFAPLLTIGFANGYIGYIPSRQAYRNRTDYACYYAPMFTQGFPFTPEIEALFLRESRRILKRLVK